MRIDVRKTAQLKKGEVIVGNQVKAKVVKNKVAPPFRVAEFDILYNEGISYEGDLITTGTKYDIVKKTGNTLSFKETKLGVGVEQTRQFLKENPKIAKEIVDAIKKEATEQKNRAVEIE